MAGPVFRGMAMRLLQRLYTVQELLFTLLVPGPLPSGVQLVAQLAVALLQPGLIGGDAFPLRLQLLQFVPDLACGRLRGDFRLQRCQGLQQLFGLLQLVLRLLPGFEPVSLLAGEYRVAVLAKAASEALFVPAWQAGLAFPEPLETDDLCGSAVQRLLVCGLCSALDQGLPLPDPGWVDVFQQGTGRLTPAGRGSSSRRRNHWPAWRCCVCSRRKRRSVAAFRMAGSGSCCRAVRRFSGSRSCQPGLREPVKIMRASLLCTGPARMVLEWRRLAQRL